MATNLHENWVRNGWQERLDQLLDLLTDYDILLIEAQAGFGKRRTIERWHHLLAGSGKTIFRLDCDAADMAGDFPGASARGIRWHRNPDRARQAMAHFAEAMHEAQILIIENLHDLACGDLAFVRDRLCDLPPMSNAILTCRDMPREWAAPLVARGQLRIIGEDQLTLDFDEFAERLERLCGENFPLPVLRHIFSITGGWSVAIEHAAAYILASSNWRDASENFPDIWPELSHWIEDNIWRDLDAGDRRRLIAAAKSDAPIAQCPGVHPGIAAAESIGDLSRKTPFLHHDKRGIPSLRRIAGSFLREIADDGGPDSPLHKQRLATTGHPSFVLPAATDRSSLMTGGMLLDLIASGEAAAARQWLEAAPRKLDGSASAQLAITMLGFSDRAKRLPAPGVAGKARRFHSATDQSILIEAMAAAVEDDIDKLDSSLDHFPRSNDLAGPFKAAGLMLRLRCLQRLGQAQPFASMTLAIHDELRLVSNFGFYCSATLVDGATLLNLGQSEAAVRLFTRIRALALERLGESAVPTIELSAMLGAAQLQAQQPDHAGMTLKNWALFDLAGIDPFALQAGYMTLARLEARDGRHLNAIGLLETLERAATERRLRLLQVQASAEIARTAILGGCLSAARKAETSLRTMAGHSGSWGPKRGALILLDAASGLAQIAAWKHEWDEALQWIGEAQPLALQFGRLYEHLRMGLLQDHCRNKLDPGSPLAHATETSVGPADRAGLLSEIESLLEQPRGRRTSAPKPGDMSSKHAVMLTQKEREVLELMARGFSKPLIAGALNISSETVKWHQKNIYTKFDIHDRHNVLSQARRMGLV